MSTYNKDLPHILFNLKETSYSIPSDKVLSITILENNISSMPESPDYIRGIMDWRGKVVKLIDLRKFLKMKSIPQEIIEFGEMLVQRKQDHIDWLKELENSVKENREFNLTTDPHKCTFGRWFDSFKTKDISLNSLLIKIDRVHKKIHKVGDEIKSCQENNLYTKAKEILKSTWDIELKMLSNLFDDFIEAYRISKRETVFVLENKSSDLGLIVDRVDSVENINDEKLFSIYKKGSKSHTFIGKRNDGSPIILFNVDYLFKLNNDSIAKENIMVDSVEKLEKINKEI